MAPLSYAKWDAIDVDEDEEDLPRRPRVTRLEGPARITIGPNGQSPVCASAPPPSAAAAIRGGIDYSKWDAIEVDDEDDDSDDEEMETDGGLGGEGGASEASSAVATAADGCSHTPADSASGAGSGPLLSSRPCTVDEETEALAERDAEAVERDALDAEEEAQLRQALAAKNIVLHPPPPTALPPSSSEQYEALAAQLSRNGGRRSEYLWRQTEAEVEVSVLLTAGSRARDLRVQLRDEPVRGRQRLVVAAVDGRALFDKELAFPVEQPEEEEDLLWEVTDFESDGGRRALRLTLTKQKVHGVVIWWTRAFDGEEELDPLSFPDRKRAKKAAGQQAVWAEAQRMFRERVAARGPPQSIDVGSVSQPQSGSAPDSDMTSE